jgi:2-methylcitrate dehydratase PrpD
MTSGAAGMCGGRDVILMPAAQMSLPYAVAARLAFGGAGLSAYAEERRRDPALHRAMTKVVLSTDDRMAPNDEPYITMVLADGRKLEERVTVALGAPNNPLGDEALLAKFEELAGMVLSSAKTRALADTVFALDRLADCRSLPALLAPGAA